jgi:hypothetical protein
VGFFPCGEEQNYQEEWYENKASFEAADKLQLTAPTGLQGIDAALIPSSGPAAKEVHLRARPKRVEKGDRVTLEARVFPCGGEAGDVVNFMRGNRKIDTDRTNGSCKAVTQFRAKRSGVYRAVSPADGDLLEGSSMRVKVKVRRD